MGVEQHKTAWHSVRVVCGDQRGSVITRKWDWSGGRQGRHLKSHPGEGESIPAVCDAEVTSHM